MVDCTKVFHFRTRERVVFHFRTREAHRAGAQAQGNRPVKTETDFETEAPLEAAILHAHRRWCGARAILGGIFGENLDRLAGVCRT